MSFVFMTSAGGDTPFTGNAPNRIYWPIWQGYVQPLLADSLLDRRYGADGHVQHDAGTVAQPSRVRLVGWARTDAERDTVLDRLATIGNTVTSVRQATGETIINAYLRRPMTMVKALRAASQMRFGNAWHRVRWRIEVQMEVIRQPD